MERVFLEKPLPSLLVVCMAKYDDFNMRRWAEVFGFFCHSLYFRRGSSISPPRVISIGDFCGGRGGDSANLTVNTISVMAYPFKLRNLQHAWSSCSCSASCYVWGFFGVWWRSQFLDSPRTKFLASETVIAPVRFVWSRSKFACFTISSWSYFLWLV